jgi:uncharacterized protein YjiS (DUF1127 family)
MSRMHPPLPQNARLCPAFDGYAVTSDGIVLSCWRTSAGIGPDWRTRKTHAVAGRSGVYEQIVLQRDGRPVVTSVHRLVLEAFRGPCPDGHETRHLNGNSLDNRLDNLAWGTRADNSADKRRHGTMQSGARNGGAKLTAKQVEQIRELRPHRTLQQLADAFGISRSQVKRIVYGQSWQ